MNSIMELLLDCISLLAQLNVVEWEKVSLNGCNRRTSKRIDCCYYRGLLGGVQGRESTGSHWLSRKRNWDRHRQRCWEFRSHYYPFPALWTMSEIKSSWKILWRRVFRKLLIFIINQAIIRNRMAYYKTIIVNTIEIHSSKFICLHFNVQFMIAAI